jgi:autotransporter-associated beta strand protein
VFLNNTSFLHNTVIGGTGGTNSPYGGTLDNIGTLNQLGHTTNGLNGVSGTQVFDDQYKFGDGTGNGVPGCCHTDGKDAINGFGGLGGNGGAGTNGWGSNPVAQLNVTLNIENVVNASLGTAIDVANLIKTIGIAVATDAAQAQPLEEPLATVVFTDTVLSSVLITLQIANDGINLANAVGSLILAQAQLDSWNHQFNLGLVGNGGSGETGGNGGRGSYGFGGGGGGNGGPYGLSASPAGLDGWGGSGGNGGAGGFGGGGGAGGYAYGAGLNGCGANGCTSQNGTPGAGGAPGWGGGVGSTGGITGGSTTCLGGTPGIACGGGGGYGFGGAIFVNSGATLIVTGNANFEANTAFGGVSLNNGQGGGSTGADLFIMPGGRVILAPGAGNVITFNDSIADASTASNEIPEAFPPLSTAVGQGGGVTIYAGTTIFNGWDTYSGQTVINGGALGGPLNPGTNTPGALNYALTDGALQIGAQGLPINSNLNFSGPGQFTGGVLQVSGNWSREVNPNPNPNGGGNTGSSPASSVQWTGSGGFAAIGSPVNITLNTGGLLNWGANGFVPFGYSLIFGSATSDSTVTFANPIDISGGSLGAGTAASILVGNNGNAAGSTAIMAAVISGSGDLSINGGGLNGTLVLTAANTYTGATVVNSGTLALSGNGSIASSSSLTIGLGASFDISGSTAGATIPNLSGSGTIFLGRQELTVQNGGTFSGVLADGGISGGTMGSLIIAGGTETLTGINTYTGDTTINPGATLALFGAGSISNSSVVIDNGTFDISQVALGTMITSLAGSGQALIGWNVLIVTNGSTTFSGDINDGGIGGGTGGSLMVTGGTQTLSGVNTYTGVTFVGAGATLALGGGGSIATSVAVAVLGTFDISQTNAGASITTLLGNGNVALGSQALTITNASTTFDGAITDGGIGGGAGGSLVIAGGTQTLSGTNTYTGTTTINPGATLALTGGGSIAKSSNVIDNGTFDISQTSAGAAITTLSGSGTVSLGSQLLAITNGSTTFSGVIADGGIAGGTGGMLAVTGGTQTFSGVNTYTGGTLISGGATLALSGVGSIAKSLFVDAVGTFDISQTTAGASITTLTGSGNVNLGAQELTITNGATTFSGVLSDGGISGGTKGSLIVSGGTETLSGVNTYTGDTTIAPNPITGTATLALTGNGSIATSSVVAIATNGTFDISQTASGASIVTLADSGANPSGNVALGSQTLTITNGSTTFSGVIADGGIGGGTAGNLKVTGGTQTLAGVNAYTGLTTIAPSAGTATLALKGSGSIATSSEVLVATNGTFDISQTTSGASVKTLSGSGSVVLGSQVLTLTAAAAGAAGTDPAGIFSGGISGLGGMAITGGHEELTGLNTYQGGTLVTNGATLSINSSSSLGASNSTLTLNNGTLVVDGSITIPQPVTFLGAPPGIDLINLNSNNVTFSGPITGPGVLTANGGSLNLTGTVTGLGGVVLGPGVTFTTSATASAGLATTPIVLVPTSGTPVDLFTGSVHVVGPLDVMNGATPELILGRGDTLKGAGSVNATVLLEGGTAAPGDGAATMFISGPVIDKPGSTYTVAIDGPVPSATNCPNPPNANGCAGQYSSVVVTGGNTYTANGTIVPVLNNIGLPANNTYIPPVTTRFTILSAPGGVLGSFSSITQPALGVPGVPNGGGLSPGTRFDALYFNASASPTTLSAIDYAQNAAGNPTAVHLWVTPASYQNLSAWNTFLTKKTRVKWR